MQKDKFIPNNLSPKLKRQVNKCVGVLDTARSKLITAADRAIFFKIANTLFEDCIHEHPSLALGVARRYGLGNDLQKKACLEIITQTARSGQCLFHGSGAQKAMIHLRKMGANEIDIRVAIKKGIDFFHGTSHAGPEEGKKPGWTGFEVLSEPCEMMNAAFGCRGRE